MDNRDIESIRDVEAIDRVLKRTKPDPSPSWLALIITAFVGVFLAWMFINGIEKAAFDAVNGMMGQ